MYSLILWEERVLKMSQNGVLIAIFETKTDEIAGNWRIN
jgi:hypothetical protein